MQIDYAGNNMVTIKCCLEIAINYATLGYAEGIYLLHSKDPVCTLQKNEGFTSSLLICSSTTVFCQLIQLSSFYVVFFTANSCGNHLRQLNGSFVSLSRLCDLKLIPQSCFSEDQCTLTVKRETLNGRNETLV
jgi:hypothetical protein